MKRPPGPTCGLAVPAAGSAEKVDVLHALADQPLCGNRAKRAKAAGDSPRLRRPSRPSDGRCWRHAHDDLADVARVRELAERRGDGREVVYEGLQGPHRARCQHGRQVSERAVQHLPAAIWTVTEEDLTDSHTCTLQPSKVHHRLLVENPQLCFEDVQTRCQLKVGGSSALMMPQHLLQSQ